MTGRAARALGAPGGYVSRMTERVAQILELADGLSREEREELIDKLVGTVEPAEDEPVDEAVAREAVRRLREVEQGEAETIPAEEVFAELKARLRAKSA